MNLARARSPLLDEGRMIAAIVAGDRELYHTLIQPYEHRVYRIALSLVKEEAEAEDVAQEAFLKAFRELATFRGEAKFSTWLISITLNEARRRLRHQKLVRMESLDEPAENRAGLAPAMLRDWREIPSEALERREMKALLQMAIGRLPPLYREVLVLRDMEGLSIAETSLALAISTAAVKVRLHRARMMLQKDLAPKLKTTTLKRRRWFS